MTLTQTSARVRIVDQTRHDPLLSDFAKPLPDLLGRRKAEPATIFSRMGRALSTTARTGAVQAVLIRGSRTRHWSLTLSPGHCQVLNKKTSDPNLTLRAAQSVWTELARGKISFLEAFVQGKLRVQGDLELARSMARTLQKSSNVN